MLRMIDTPRPPVFIPPGGEIELGDQELGVGGGDGGESPRDRNQVPIGGLAAKRLNKRVDAKVVRGCRGVGGPTDGSDLHVDQRDFVKAEATLLEMGGCKLHAPNVALDTNDQEQHTDQNQCGEQGDPAFDDAVPACELSVAEESLTGESPPAAS